MPCFLRSCRQPLGRGEPSQVGLADFAVMAASDDGEAVDAFLERIASLKIKRDREDEERTRKLEEEILQGRRERQARRAGEPSRLVFTVRS